MAERRYSETEVAEIIQRATEAQHSGRVPLASGEGMTLGALQEIGREVGIAPELIARAAKSLDAGGREYTRRFAGLPIGVGRTVELDRTISDAEWERIVVDLRETFDARGRLKQEGSFRQWTNGNLQALVEPTESGHRVRLRTLNGSAQMWMMGGLAIIGVGVVTLISAVAGGVPQDAETWSKFLSLAGLGAGVFGIGAIRLPGWARLRRRQMEEVAGRISSQT